MLKNFIKKYIFNNYSNNTITNITNYITTKEFKESLEKKEWWCLVPHLYNDKITVMSFKSGPFKQYSVYNHQTGKLESVAKYSNTIEDFQNVINALNTLHTATKCSKVAIHLAIANKNNKGIEFTPEKVGNKLYELLPTITKFKDYQVLAMFVDKNLAAINNMQEICVAENLPLLLDFKIESNEELNDIYNNLPIKTYLTGFYLDGKVKIVNLEHTPKGHGKSKKSNKKSRISHS